MRRNCVVFSELREVFRVLYKKVIIRKNDTSICARLEAFTALKFKIIWSIVL
jgi:hypothetical protein